MPSAECLVVKKADIVPTRREHHMGGDIYYNLYIQITFPFTQALFPQLFLAHLHFQEFQ